VHILYGSLRLVLTASWVLYTHTVEE